jgi:hypothetical protein
MQGVAGKTRNYYIAAEEGEWDYAPNGDTVTYMLPDHRKHNTKMMQAYLAKRRYKKAMYVAYQDGSFTRKVRQT